MKGGWGGLADSGDGIRGVYLFTDIEKVKVTLDLSNEFIIGKCIEGWEMR